MQIKVCVGSSCHIRGSSKVIQLIKNAIKENELEDKVTLSAAFCLGKCTDGVSVMVDDKVVCGVNESTFDDFFNSNIMSVI